MLCTPRSSGESRVAIDPQRAFNDFFRAIEIIGVHFDHEGLGSQCRLSTMRARLLKFVRQEALPDVLCDFIRFGEVSERLRVCKPRPSPSVKALTPILTVAAARIGTQYPILPYLSCVLDDPFMLSRRKSEYLVLSARSAVDPIQVIEVADVDFIDSLLHNKPLESLLQPGVNVPRRLGWLQSLWKLGVLTWAQP